MWIETEIKGTFTTKKGDQMVSFTAKREDGRNWAAPLRLVSKGVGGNADAGLAVRINVERERVDRVQRNRHQPVGAVQTVPANVLPYGFVPINLDHAVHDDPIWHDGSGGGEFLSGEIRCELEALTPLLPGNMRYLVRKDGKDDGAFLINDVLGCILKKLVGQEPKASKHIAEPLRLPDGHVVIAGSAIKGMIRHSLGALTAAPMERVTEHHYTYRPNLGRADVPMCVCRPAVVDRKEGEEWIVKVLPEARDAIFRTDQRTTEAVEFIYKGGIDGQGILAQSAPHITQVYKKAWISSAKLKKAEECRISKTVFDAYLKTQCVLYTDHISPAHPQAKKFDHKEVLDAIKKATDIEPRQLIYVEKKVDSNEIVSFGHHYQYRWAYTSSVRSKDGQPRPCLTPMEFERTQDGKDQGEDIAPKHLTGARLLFGYVHDPKTNLVGKGVYERLAGRIAINHAVSDGVPEFLSPETGYCVPLKILGQPKPSAWEFYLQQPEDASQPLMTYGDLPNHAGGELAGRKFYRHQQPVSIDHIKATTPEEVNSEQATLARFICDTGTKFKFAIRFARLRDWELGALLAVLEPHLLASSSEPERYAHKLGLGRPMGMGSVRITPKEIRLRLEKDVNFLGQAARDERAKLALEALQGKLDPGTLKDWLEAHELVNGRRLGYPVDKTKKDGQWIQAIYAWHTEVRREYSKLRREQGANWSQLSGTVRKVK